MIYNKKLSVIVPIMNEQGNIVSLYNRLESVLSNIINFEIIFVDDGSTDQTLGEIKKIGLINSNVKYLSFSRNFGHQNALRAGLDFANGDCIVSLDGDLQHPPELIPEMLKAWQDGNDIIYTIREDSKDSSFFKRKTSSLFYNLINYLSDVSIDEGSADYRLIDRKVLEVLVTIKENPIFYRGITKWIGFKQHSISYIPEARQWGKTKYSVKKMFSFAIFGITSFSIKPLRFSIIFGFLFAMFAFLYGLYAVFIKFYTSSAIPGWTSLLILVSLIGGIQLIMIGVLGEYLGKLFIESKNRPSYIIKEKNI